MTVRPRRSALYMPGSNARAMEKARELPADAVIFDLEDAVAPDAKATARTLIIEALKKGGITLRARLTRPVRWYGGDVHDPDRARSARPGTWICRDQLGPREAGGETGPHNPRSDDLHIPAVRPEQLPSSTHPCRVMSACAPGGTIFPQRGSLCVDQRER